MLRQALDAAKEEEENHQQQDEQQSQHSGSETTSLATRPEDYGSIMMDAVQLAPRHLEMKTMMRIHSMQRLSNQTVYGRAY
jgi:hypothetical protein